MRYYFSVLGKCVETFINRNPLQNDHNVIRSRNCFSCFPTFLFPRGRVNATKFNTKIQLSKIFEHFNFCHCEKQNNIENSVEDDVFLFVFKVFLFFFSILATYFILLYFLFSVYCAELRNKKDILVTSLHLDVSFELGKIKFGGLIKITASLQIMHKSKT